MTEKYRVIDGFDYKNEPCKLIEYIETEERYSTENDLEANSLCKLLNEQEETILKQKRKIKELIVQLKTDEEDGVCIKCKHHYLINHPESSKYYISKCKKEHEECSKEYIRFCEDFELDGDD